MQNVGLKRNTIDKFYTKPTIVNLCIEYIKNILNISPTDLIIEPSAGSGSFIPAIKTLSNHHLFYDIAPAHAEVIKADFLTVPPPEITSHIHVIGNPPFGKLSSLAKKFIKKSCSFANTISFILPKSVKKDSFKKTFPLNFHLIFEVDLPTNSFLVNNEEYDVPCIFQIWIKKDENREVPNILAPIGFQFVKKTEQPDISFRRVGVNAGKVSIETEDKSEQSHYFIKFEMEDMLEKFQNLSFSFNNTVGPKSISKQELIQAVSI